MDKFCALFFIAFLGSIAAVKIVLFDSVGFNGPYLTTTEEEGCTNLNTSNFIQEARSLKTDACIIVFKDTNCTSYSYRLDAGEYSDLFQVKHETVNFLNPLSYRLCTDEEGGTAVNVDIYGFAMIMGEPAIPPYQGLLLEYRDVCSCINLPSKTPYIANVTRIHNYGNCIKLYSGVNCTSTAIELLGGVSPQSEDLSSVGLGQLLIPGSSIGLCNPRPTCHTLHYSVFKFDLSADEHQAKLTASTDNVAITSSTTLSNNGTATITQEYEAKTTIREVMEVSRIELITTDVYKREQKVETSSSGWWFWYSSHVSSTLIETFTNNATQAGNRFVTDESREVTVRQEIELPPCSVYEIDSYVTMMKNFPVNYTMYAHVSGISNNQEPLKAPDVVDRLPVGMVYVKDIDEYTIVAMTEGTVVADFSMQAIMRGEGSRIDNCGSGNGNGTVPSPPAIHYVQPNSIMS